jgi:uncharacterized membrane protein YkoI
MLKSSIFLVALLLSAGCSLQAQKDLPAAVKTAFAQKFPDADDVEWDKEKDGNWEVEFEQGDTESTAVFSPDGKWLETETEIALEDLPEPIRAAVKGKKIKEVARITKADGTTVYEVEVGKKDLMYDPQGNLLPEGKE